jgi:hypothetical protein
MKKQRLKRAIKICTFVINAEIKSRKNWDKKKKKNVSLFEILGFQKKERKKNGTLFFYFNRQLKYRISIISNKQFRHLLISFGHY